MNRNTLSRTLPRAAAGMLAGAALLLGAGASHVFAAEGDLSRPTNLTSAALDGTSILVTWRDTNTAEGGYRVAYGAGRVDLSTATYVDAPEVDGINGNGFYTVRGLGPGTKYCFQVMAFNDQLRDYH